MKNQTTRVCVYPKDVQRITGKSERYGRMLLIKIRENYKKEGHQFITVDEFCSYTGIKLDQVLPLLS